MSRNVRSNVKTYAFNLLCELQQLKEEHCDFIILVDGMEYRTHKIILSLGSSYFRAMLKHGMKEIQEGKVEMKDVDSECVASCLKYIYSGCFDLPDGKIGELLYVAAMLQLDHVIKAISDILFEELSVKNFYETQNLASTYTLNGLSSKCTKFYKENFLAITGQSQFAEVPKSHLEEIFKSKHLRMSEEEKVELSLRWLGDEPDDKMKDAVKLLASINFSLIPPEYLRDLMESNPFIKTVSCLRKTITAALRRNARKGRKKTEKKMILLDDENGRFRSMNFLTKKVSYIHNEKFDHLERFKVASMGDYIYVFCKDRSVHRLYLRDKNSKWQQLHGMLSYHGERPPTVAHMKSFYVATSSDDPTNDVEKFDPDENQWQKLRDKPKAVSGTALVSLNDYIYCIGGFDGNTTLNELCRFTPATQEWVDLDPMGYKRRDCGAAAANQNIFVTGGNYRDGSMDEFDHESVAQVECYEINSRQWTPLLPMLNGYCRNNAVFFNDCIYTVRPRGFSFRIQKYDISNDRWCEAEFRETNIKVYDLLTIE